MSLHNRMRQYLPIEDKIRTISDIVCSSYLINHQSQKPENLSFIDLSNGGNDIYKSPESLHQNEYYILITIRFDVLLIFEGNSEVGSRNLY